MPVSFVFSVYVAFNQEAIMVRVSVLETSVSSKPGVSTMVTGRFERVKGTTWMADVTGENNIERWFRFNGENNKKKMKFGKRGRGRLTGMQVMSDPDVLAGKFTDKRRLACARHPKHGYQKLVLAV